jgi:hypothetical protein
MIWALALPSQRYIILDRDSIYRQHHSPAILFANREAREVGLKHYTKPSCTIQQDSHEYRYFIRENYIDYAVDAFDAVYFMNEYWGDKRDNMCKIVIPIEDIIYDGLHSSLCHTGVCHGRLPSLEEIIFSIHRRLVWPDEDGEDTRKLLEVQDDENFLLRLRKIKTEFKEWLRECSTCSKVNKNRSILNKELTFARFVDLDGYLPAELVPFEFPQFPERKRYQGMYGVRWC